MFVGVFGVHRSIVSPLGDWGSIADRVGEDRSMMSLADTDGPGRVGVFGVVPIDVVFAGVIGIVPNEVILIGVLGSVPLDTIVVMAERKRTVVGCRSSRVSSIP